MTTPEEVMRWLRAEASEDHRASLARYNIPTEHALGIPMGALKKQAKLWGRDHRLASALWSERTYEARIIAAHVADPTETDAALMDAWTADFDNWAICDTCCFTLFAKAPPRWERVPAYAAREEEFVKRTACALLSCLVMDQMSAKAVRLTNSSSRAA
ncbi:MAG: DNA alkylation repair protein, partial [Pseudomonadota bacterium]